jgi:hypothetical protein
MSPKPAGKKLVTAQSKTSFVSGGSVRNAVQVLSQYDATIFVISMTFNLSVANDFVETPDMIANPEAASAARIFAGTARSSRATGTTRSASRKNSNPRSIECDNRMVRGECVRRVPRANQYARNWRSRHGPGRSTSGAKRFEVPPFLSSKRKGSVRREAIHILSDRPS